MFRISPKRTYLPIAPDAISALYRSTNNASVLLPGQPSALASAVVVGYRLESRLYGVVIALNLSESGRNLVYTHDGGELDTSGARKAAQEAIAFVETLGFFMENAGWKGLDPAARQQMLTALKVFHPPQTLVEEPKVVVDPRTKLARLLVQF